MSKKSNRQMRADRTSRAGSIDAQSLAPLPLTGVMLSQALRFHQQGLLDQARALYEAVLQIEPVNFDALHLCGVLSSDKGHAEAAVRYIGQALAIRPDSVHAYQNLGIALRMLKRPLEALAAYEKGLRLEPHNPGLLNNLGNVLLEIGRPREALSSYDKAIALAPNLIDAHDNRGNALREMHRFDEALASYERAQSISPDFASAHWNESLCRLLNGDFAKGWQKYEWGWQVGTRGRQRKFAAPLWLGHESIEGKTILLHAEQGLGDSIQFSRYTSEIASMGAHVILEIQPALKELMSSLAGPKLVMAVGEPLPAFDFHCPLASLPLALNIDLASTPCRPAYLCAEPALLEKWATKLGPRKTLRVGIAWSGNTQHSRNHQRSVSLRDMIGLHADGIQLFSLQKDLNGDDQATIEQSGKVSHFGEDFANTAALASLMDIVVSVDTSIAHLSAALGLPTWILLAHTPDWRWMLNRTDSPWYPSARLFRQPEPGDWSHVLGTVGEALKEIKVSGSAPIQGLKHMQEK